MSMTRAEITQKMDELVNKYRETHYLAELRFATLWLAVVIIGFAVSFYVLPYGLIWFVNALLF